MLIRNKWTAGKVHFQIPQLPPQYVGKSGAMFKAFTFDKRVGKETALMLLDDPQFSRKLGAISPFTLVATSGVVRTSAGIIAYVIWSVSSRQGHVVDYEHHLNPFDNRTIRLISGVGQQTHLKVLMVDSQESEVVGFVEIDNSFGMDNFVAGLAQVVGNERTPDFAATQAALQAEFSLEMLKGSEGSRSEETRTYCNSLLQERRVRVATTARRDDR